MSKIEDFYNGKNIFITGGTGFLGKIVIEKLIRSFPKIGTIYLLIRPKRGKEMKERLDTFSKSTIFEPLEKIDCNFRKKIVGISGDGMKPGMGISIEDRILLANEVSIIFHAAATVKFNERLPIAVAINVNAVKELIVLCRACKKLKAAVYVSTAFSNCIYDEIDEKVYPAPMSYEKINILTRIMKNKNLSEEDEEKLTKDVLGKFPNTYTFTKAIAENMINEYAKDLPFCIYRFSIALSTYKEPFPGWVDAYQGLNTAVAQTGKGFIRVIGGNPEARCDMVPADYASNALIASAWESGVIQRREGDDVPVYNYVSGTDNPMTWGDLKALIEDYGWRKGTTKSLYFPSAMMVKSPIAFAIVNFFLHLVPALMADAILKLSGRKPIFYKVYTKGLTLLEALMFFITNNWTFETKNVRGLWNKLSETDKKLLPFDITSFKWHDAIDVYLDGCKKFIVKDTVGIENPEISRRWTRKLYVIHQIVKFTFGSLVLWLIFNIGMYFTVNF